MHLGTYTRLVFLAIIGSLLAAATYYYRRTVKQIWHWYFGCTYTDPVNIAGLEFELCMVCDTISVEALDEN